MNTIEITLTKPNGGKVHREFDQKDTILSVVMWAKSYGINNPTLRTKEVYYGSR